MSRITDEIVENQRRILHLPGVFKSNAVAEALHVGLDQQYSKTLLHPHDPGAWVGSDNVTISSPGAYPLADGYGVLQNWVYIVNPPMTDAGGWEYMDDFTSDNSSPTNTITTQVRCRRWQRVSCPIAELKVIQDEEERKEEEAAEEGKRQAAAEAAADGPHERARAGWYPGKFVGKLVHKIEHKIKPK